MKKSITTVVLSASLFILGTQAVLAERVAVSGNSVFILDSSVIGSQIVVKDFDGNASLACPSPILLNLATGISATEILVKNGKAIVTTATNTIPETTNVIFADVTSCLSTANECYAAVQDGKLTIPCLMYNGELISVVLGQRGNSMNYEFEKASNHGHSDDD